MKRTIVMKLISAFISLMMMLGVVASTVFATVDGAEPETSSSNEKPKFNYVSLGASNVNGYGMFGYVEDWAYDYPLEKANLNVYGYKADTPGSYPVLLAQELSKNYDVKLSQMAISSMRAEEVKFLLYDDAVADKYTEWRFYNESDPNVSYDANWFVSAGYKEMGYDGEGAAPSHAEALAALRAEYKNVLVNADLVTVDVGMNNFGVYLQKQIKNKNAFGADLSTLDPDVAAKYEEGKEFVFNVIKEKLGDTEIPMDFLSNAVDAFAFALVGYCMSFDDIVSWIYANNPDATVVAVSVQNLMDGLKATIPGVDAELPLGDIFGAVINAANTYTAVLSPYASKYYYANVSADGHVELFGDEANNYNGDPSTIGRDMKDCFDIYDNSIFLKTQIQKQFALELNKAGYLSMHDMQKGMDDMGLILYYNGFHYDLQSDLYGQATTGDHWHIKMFVGESYEMYYKDFLTYMSYREQPETIELIEDKTKRETLKAILAAYEPVLSQFENAYASYKQSLNIAYDVMVEIMQAASKIDTVDLSYLSVRPANQLLTAYFETILMAIAAAGNDLNYNFNLSDVYPDGFFETFAARYNLSVEAVYTFIYFEFAGMIGNSFFAHPNAEGQKQIFDIIWKAYTEKITGEDVVIGNIMDVVVVITQIEERVAKLKIELTQATGTEKEKISKEIAMLEEMLNALENADSDSFNNATTGNFTPNEDSYIVSVNGGNAVYAEMLAATLGEKLGINSIKLGNTVWGDIDYSMLAAADFITIGYDENEMSDFAVDQMFARVAKYLNNNIRGSLENYLSDVLETLNGAGYSIAGKMQAEILSQFNGIIDQIVNHKRASGVEIVELDWVGLLGAEKAKQVDKLLSAIRSEIVAAGYTNDYVLEIDVVEYIFSAYPEINDYIAISKMYEELGDKAIYAVEIPAADALVYAVESYLYSYLKFQVEYSRLLIDLRAINPDATVILLGQYNAFDKELTLGNTVIAFGDLYSLVAELSSVQPFLYALTFENVIYVDISNAETEYDALVNAGVIDNTLLNFVIVYINDSGITDVSEHGSKFIHDQIINSLVLGCTHKYDNACDAVCNNCGFVRQVGNHIYNNACDVSCNECGAIREVADHEYNDNGLCIYCGVKQDNNLEHTHIYDGCTDTDCNICGEIRKAGEHSYNTCEDVLCSKCGATIVARGHAYTNCDDADCNVCGKERVPLGHSYSNDCDTTCNICRLEREALDHVYSGCDDATCNICGAERTAGAHVVDDCEDNVCNVCGQKVIATGHKYGAWVVTKEATRNTAGEKMHTCAGCGKIETRVIEALGGISGGAIAAIVIGSVVVLGATGFAIYWFLIRKKSVVADSESPEEKIADEKTAADEEAPVNEE